MIAESPSRVASLAAIDLANARAGGNFYESRWIEAGNGACHAVVAGAGSTVVFVHGFPSFWYCWIRQLEALRPVHRVVALDALGAGASGRPQSVADYSVDRLAAWLAEVLAAIAPEGKVVLVGHDWGAALAFACAQSRPERLAGVVGIAAPPYSQFVRTLAEDPDQQLRSGYMQALRTMTADRARGVAKEAAQRAYAGLLERGEIDREEAALFASACGDPAAFAAGCAWYGANLGTDATRIAATPWPGGDPALQVPGLLIWGGADETFVPTAPNRFTAANPNAEALLLVGVNHWCMLEASDQVSRAIADFARDKAA